MASYNTGKGVDRSTSWSEWEWDARGFWFSSRTGPTGVPEYEYNYPQPDNTNPYQTPQPQLPSTPRNTTTPLTQPLNSYGSSPPDETTTSSPNFTTNPTARPQFTNVQFSKPTGANFSTSPTYNSPSNLAGEQKWTGNAPSSPKSPSALTALPTSSAEQREYDPIDDMTEALPNLAVAPSPPYLKGYSNETTGQTTWGSKTKESDPRAGPTLDPRYKEIEPKKLDKFWKIGRVFMTLWAEPARDGHQIPQPKPKSGAISNASHYADSWLGGKAFFEIRRFVVIGTNWGNAQCSPIHTYGGQACFKPGLPDVHKHAIIYTSPEAPPEATMERDGKVVSEGLTKSAIRVVREQNGPEGDLGTLSRLNFSKVYTVEFYAKVLNIGMVHPNMLETLAYYASTSRDEPSQPPKHRSSKPNKGHHDDPKGGSSKASGGKKSKK